MRMGELYREAHLSAIAVEQCDSACFLWLLGAASRTVATEVSAGLEVADRKDEYRKYLVRMDVPQNMLPTMLEGAGTENQRYDSDRFSREIGERPQSYGKWLIQQCGALSEQERLDHRRIQSAGFVGVLHQMQAENPDRKDLAPIIEKYEGFALEANRFTDEYQQSLLQNWLDIRQCQREAVRLDQARVISAL